MDGKIGILIDAALHNELVLRTRKPSDVTHYIEHAITTFLDRTERDMDLWSDDYLTGLEEIDANSTLALFGDPQKGYHWQNLFLPNATNLKITYKGRDSAAEIRHQKLVFLGAEYTPSEWARHVANNTNRNAWRDIWVQFPGTSSWQLADVLRRAEKDRN